MRRTISFPADLDERVMEYRTKKAKESNFKNISTFTKAVLELVEKGLEA